MCQLKSRGTVWYEWLPSFGIVGKGGKEKRPNMWEILRHWHSWEYFNSPYSNQCLGRSWAQSPPQPCCLRNLVLAFPASQAVPGSPLQADFCLGGGSVRDLLCGGLQGFLPAAVTHIPAVVRLPKNREKRWSCLSPRESWDCHILMCLSAAFFFHSLPCTWNLIGNRPIWAEKVVSAWAVNWPACVSLSQLYCCFSTVCVS